MPSLRPPHRDRSSASTTTSHLRFAVARTLTATIFCFALATSLASILAAEPRPAEMIQYNRDILPILSSKCFACHGPDTAARKGGFRLDQHESAIKKLKSPHFDAALQAIASDTKRPLSIRLKAKPSIVPLRNRLTISLTTLFHWSRCAGGIIRPLRLAICAKSVANC